jgi:hypothetical protein
MGERVKWGLLSLLLMAVAVAGCSGGNTPEAVADRFMEAYYVQIDQGQALEFTGALARERLQQELQAVAPLRRGGSIADARPAVKYALSRTQPDGRQVLLYYDLTITPPHVPPMLKKVLIITEQLGEQWKVINFTEADAAR